MGPWRGKAEAEGDRGQDRDGICIGEARKTVFLALLVRISSLSSDSRGLVIANSV